MKIFCTLGLIVAVAFRAVDGDSMGRCISEEKFITFASKADGCQDLATTKPDGVKDRSESSQEDSAEKTAEKLEKMLKAIGCFTKQGNFVDPATNATNVDAFKASLKEIAVNDDKNNEMIAAFDECNETKATTLEAEESKKVFRCFMKKIRKLCKKEKKDD